MAASDNMFDILELTHLIANDLSQHDLFLCCLVNKQFFRAFTPHLWHSITINQNDPILKFQSPEGRTGLLRNGHHIRVLRAYDPIALESFVAFGTTCTNLVSLDVTHSIQLYAGDSTTIRTSEMLSKGRRKGSIGVGQVRVSGPPMFGVATSSTGSGFFSASASSTAGVASPSAIVHSHAERQRDGETYLISVLERNPQLEFLVVPSHCLDCEVIVKVAGETLLSLEEFYSDADLWQREPTTCFQFHKESTTSDTGRIITGPEGVVEGCLKPTEGKLSHPLLYNYPRLKELQLEISARVNHNALERIRLVNRRFNFLVITEGLPSQVIQVLTLAPPLKHLTVKGDDGHHRAYADNDSTVKVAYLRHALTLEHLDTASYDFSPDILQALLCSTPSLRTLTTMEEDLGCRPFMEVELDALRIINSPWACTQLEVFECKILNVPRPDIVDTPVVNHVFNRVLPPGPPLGPAVAGDQPPLTGAMLAAQQESHAVQRGVLRQLGRLTHLRVFRLGRCSRDWDEVEYSRLEIRGIRTMAVDSYFDRNCLEFSLE
ncbi:hypothetical protein BGZ96_001947, partial [Linnemannia gamsii]